MVQIVNKKLFNLPDKPAPVSIDKIKNIKVFLKSELPADVTLDKELEADKRAIQQHVEMTGQLPKVGKPMYAKCDGMPVPYGEVVRIEEVPPV